MYRPLIIVITLLISVLAYFIVHALSMVMIIYGRRRTVLMILAGFVLGSLVRILPVLELPITAVDLSIIGYIIPGLIAIWIDRQGLVESVSTLLIASVIVRLVLILLTSGKIDI